jgi:rhodanese-related sulfurtransferase
MAFLARLAHWMPFGSVPEIEAVELHAWLLGDAESALHHDVRTRAEWERSRIFGAVHAPITSLTREIESLDVALTRPVVAICLSAHRSIPAVRILRERGFVDVRQLGGGMRAWWAAGLPTDGGA